MRGFTLLELLLSLTILATLTAFSARSIQQALFSKAKIQGQLDDMSQMRDTLKIMERDINLAFHYQDLEKEFRGDVEKGGAASPTPAPPGSPPGYVPPTAAATPVQPMNADDQARNANRLDPVTHFVGTGEEMSFVTENSTRMIEDQWQSNLLKVDYQVKSCKQLSGKQKETKCLVRRTDPLVEGDVTKGGTDTIMLENVTEFKLRYFGKGKDDWVSEWSSKGSDAVARDSYPNAVEISLTTENSAGQGPGSANAKPRKISMQIVAQVRFPNNKPKSTDNATAKPLPQ